MKKAEIKDYHGSLFLEINGDEGTSWAIMEDEIEAIFNATQKYLQSKQKVKKVDMKSVNVNK